MLTLRLIRSVMAIAASLLLTAAASAEQPLSFSTKQLTEDFNALYLGLANAHYDLYANRSKSEYDALFEKTKECLKAPMTRHEAGVLFQEFVAFGNVAHARIEYDRAPYEDYRSADGETFPVYLRIVEGRAYVARDLSKNKELSPGSEILSINGKSMTFWLERTARHVSADTPYIAHSLLEYWFPMYLWHELGAVDQFSLVVAQNDTEPVTIQIEAQTSDAMQAASKALNESFELDSTTRIAKLLDDDVAYLRPGPFYNVEEPEKPWDNSAFVSFIDDAFESFIERKTTKLIIDLRQNPGGDNSFSDVLVAWFADSPFRFSSRFHIRSSAHARASNQLRLDSNPGMTEGPSVFFAERYAKVPYGETFEYPIPETEPRDGTRFRGRVFVLIDRHSYSNAVSVAALVQDYDFGVILGEKTSDMATTYGAMETFSLPNTELVVGFPKAHIIRPSGDAHPDGVTPDVLIRSPIIPSETDIVLEEALDHIKQF
ncbi:MAG: S41 family peptidase [Gammaproteobacteria bacterium]